MIHFISNNFVDYVLIIIFDIIVALIFFLFIPKLLRLWIRFWEQIDEKVLGEEHGERIGLYPVKPSNAPVPTPPFIHDRVLPIWLCKDESGLTYIYFEEPSKYDDGCGPHGAAVNGVHYECESNGLYIDFLENTHHTIISELNSKLHRLDNLKYGVLKINLYDEDVVSFINAILFKENK